MVDLLGDLLELHIVEETTRRDKLEIDGVINEYPIYRIPLDKLFYNDRNDRIATAICKYKDEHGEDSIDIDNREEYNAILQGFIENANPEKLNDTKESIRKKGQKRYGIVLNDGRIIDGNRRFTCLRNLYKETENPVYGYFEAAIINKNYEHSEKSIKRLELSIQIGEEEKDKYDPIDKLVGMYRDIEEKKLFTVKEYADCTNSTPAKVTKELNKAKIMVDMLEVIGAPKQYYFIRELELDSSLTEMANVVYKKNSPYDSKTLNQYKLTCYADVIAKPRNDLKYYVRDINNLDSRNLNYLLNNQKETTVKIINGLNSKGNVTLDDIYEIRRNKELKTHLEDTLAIAKERKVRSEKRDSPRENMNAALMSLKTVDCKIFPVLTTEEINELLRLYQDINALLDTLKKELDVVSNS